MSEQLTDFPTKLSKVLNHLQSELTSIRSGRVTPSVVEQIKVDAYEALTPLLELASISAPEPRLIVISPWDKSLVKNVEKALQQANLGVTPTVDGVIVRLNFPALSEERRRELVKQVGVKLEESRVSSRGVREEALKRLKDEKADGGLAEDAFFAAQKELQKLIDEQNAIIKKMGEDKEKDIMTI